MTRILGVGSDLALGDMYLRLQRAGHPVRVSVADPASADILEGMVELTSHWRAELDWLGDGIALFETTGYGVEQDALRAAGYRVIGGSHVGDQLESDRHYGQRVLQGMGLSIAPSHEFESFADGASFVRAHPGRYVFKLSGEGYASTRNYVGARDDGADVLALLQFHESKWPFAERPRFLLMEHVRGVEMGVGAFFDGQKFRGPPNLDWEHKRFFTGDIGELTGEMGTLVTYRDGEKFFAATLARAAPILAAANHVGYVNLNTIVNDAGIWPLEFTCRFGYPGFAILDALHRDGWARIFEQLLSPSDEPIATHDGYSVGVVITVPPFPYPDGYERLSKGLPILFAEMSEAERDCLHFGEVGQKGGQLVAAGTLGYLMVVTGRGSTPHEAQERAYRVVDKIAVPNMRYRNDIADHFIRRDRAELVRLGWLPER